MQPDTASLNLRAWYYLFSIWWNQYPSDATAFLPQVVLVGIQEAAKATDRTPAIKVIPNLLIRMRHIMKGVHAAGSQLFVSLNHSCRRTISRQIFAPQGNEDWEVLALLLLNHNS